MEKIRQRTANDCGVACLAMLGGVPYEQALAAFIAVGLQSQRGRKAPLASNFTELAHAGAAMGLMLAQRRFRGWERVVDAAIVKVMVQRNGNWHWVVARRTSAGIEIFDPATEHPGVEVLLQPDIRGFYEYAPAGNLLERK